MVSDRPEARVAGGCLSLLVCSAFWAIGSFAGYELAPALNAAVEAITKQPVADILNNPFSWAVITGVTEIAFGYLVFGKKIDQIENWLNNLMPPRRPRR